MAKRKLAIGIDLGGTNIKYGLADVRGKVILSFQSKSPAKESPEACMEAIIDSAAKLLVCAEKLKSQVTVIGVGSPGGIDIKSGLVTGTTPNIPGWLGMNIKKSVEKAFAFKIPCFADNDANLFLLAESVYGAAKGYSHVVGLTVGTGIGGALLLDGEIYRGHGFVGTELGHIPIIMNGRKCKCGLKGCLETYANTNAIKIRYRKYPGADKSLNTRELFALAKSGDKYANDSLDKWCEYLSVGIASAVNLLNPELVLIGGGVAESGRFLQRKIEKALEGKLLPDSAKLVKIRTARLGNKAGWLGAVVFARGMGKG